MDLLYATVEWLRSQGSDQWSTWRTWDTKMAGAFARGDVWLLLEDDAPIGTITVEFNADGADPEFWTPAEAAEPAAYISKLTIRREHGGRSLGRLLLDWTRDYAYRYGARQVRFDAWRTATRLHNYYRRAGWAEVRLVDLPHRRSGALFALPAAAHPEVYRTMTDESLAGTTLETSAAVPAESRDPAGNTQPSHTHSGGVAYQLPYVWADHPTWATWWPGYRYRVRPDVDGEHGWIAEIDRVHEWEAIGPVTSTSFPLVRDTTYVITHHGTWPDCRMIVCPAHPTGAHGRTDHETDDA